MGTVLDLVASVQHIDHAEERLVYRGTGVPRRSLIAAWSVFFAYALWLAVRVGSLRGLAFTASTLLFFALPGLFIGLALFGRKVLRNPETVIFGSVFGIAASAYGVMATGYVASWSLRLMTASVVVLIVVSACFYMLQKRPAPLAEALRDWTYKDYAILLATWAVLVGFVTYPYLSVGKQTAQGLAFTWLFGFDFLLRSAIASSMTLGLPPDYLHLAGEPLRYYLVSYAIPAFAYTATGKAVPLHNILFLVQIAFSMLFLACMYCVLRRFIRDYRALFCTSMAIVLGYSYYGWYVIAKSMLLHFVSAQKLPASLINFGDVSHLYQRLFLVEPQALTGLCVFLLVFFVLECIEYRLTNYAVAVLLGLMTGVEFGIEGWQGLVLVAWVGSVFAWRWLRNRSVVISEFRPVLAAGAASILVYGSFFLLGTYQLSSGKALIIRPYWWAMIMSPVYFPVEYGPMFLLGIWGLWRMWKGDRSRITAPVMLLLLITLVQIFFVTAEVLPEFGLLRGNRLLPIVLLIWTGYAFERLFRDYSHKKLVPALGVGLLVLALPTLFTDVHATSNVQDSANTHYVRPADLQACDWIRRNLPESAIIQSEPDYIGQDNVPAKHNAIELSLIANFAERRMAVGEYWIASTVIVNSKPIARERYVAIHSMFRSSTLENVAATATRYRLDYLYLGPYEQRLYPQFLGLVKSAPSVFSEVYDENGVHIFKYNRSTAGAVPVNWRASVGVSNHTQQAQVQTVAAKQ